MPNAENPIRAAQAIYKYEVRDTHRYCYIFKCRYAVSRLGASGSDAQPDLL